MKTVVDRVVQYANRYELTNAVTGEVLGTFDFDEVTGTVQQVGTEIDAELFDSIAADLAARVVSAGGELAGTIVTFSDINGTAANVASGDKTSTLWGKVKNWFSRLKALAFKDKISNSDIDDGTISKNKIDGLTEDLNSKYVKPSGGIPTSDLEENAQNNLENVNKSLYNLGAYDTFVDNGNGTATITRKTGYIYLDPNIYSEWVKNDSSTAVVWVANGLYAGAADVAAGAAEVRCNTFKSLSPWEATNTYSIQVGIYSDGRVSIEISLNQSSAETVADVVRYLSVHPTYIQHLSATSYTEEVILDQPIHTIDQHGEQWLRDEWEKGLNLTDVTFIGTGQYTDAYRVTRDVFKPNNVYTISFDTKNTGAQIYFNETVFRPVHLSEQSDLDVTADGTHKYLTVQCLSSISNELVLAKNRIDNTDTNADGSSFYNWMITEGNGLYPYQPYNGDIIRQKDIDGDISPSNIDIYDGSINLYKSTKDSPGGNLNFKGDVCGGIYFNIPKVSNYARYMCMVDNSTELAAASVGFYGVPNVIPNQLYLTLSNGKTWQEPYIYGHSSINAGLFINRDGYVTSQGELRENNQRVATRSWVNSTLDGYALKTDIPSDATTTRKGIATLGASGGAARYGQKGDVGLGNVDNVKQYSASNPPPYGTLTFTGAVNDSFSANQDKTINIPTVSGVTPDLTIGTVTTGEPGTDASATITGTSENPVLNLTIPRGEPGAKGDTGEVGDISASDITSGILPVARGGTGVNTVKEFLIDLIQSVSLATEIGENEYFAAVSSNGQNAYRYTFQTLLNFIKDNFTLYVHNIHITIEHEEYSLDLCLPPIVSTSSTAYASIMHIFAAGGLFPFNTGAAGAEFMPASGDFTSDNIVRASIIGLQYSGTSSPARIRLKYVYPTIKDAQDPTLGAGRIVDTINLSLSDLRIASDTVSAVT